MTRKINSMTINLLIIFNELSISPFVEIEILEHCYKIDDDYTQQLLTYELKNFSDQTCLSLAVSANHRAFIAQIIM
jgi:hypothetical protein